MTIRQVASPVSHTFTIGLSSDAFFNNAMEKDLNIAIENGDAILYLDSEGNFDAMEEIKKLAKEADREKDFVFVDHNSKNGSGSISKIDFFENCSIRWILDFAFSAMEFEGGMLDRNKWNAPYSTPRLLNAVLRGIDKLQENNVERFSAKTIEKFLDLAKLEAALAPIKDAELQKRYVSGYMSTDGFLTSYDGCKAAIKSFLDVLSKFDTSSENSVFPFSKLNETSKIFFVSLPTDDKKAKDLLSLFYFNRFKTAIAATLGAFVDHEESVMKTMKKRGNLFFVDPAFGSWASSVPYLPTGAREAHASMILGFESAESFENSVAKKYYEHFSNSVNMIEQSSLTLNRI